jgi:hypothetical protein
MTSIQYSEDPKLRTAQKIVFWTVIGLAGVTLFGVLFGLVIQFLWNATLVPLFEISTISFWQAVGLFILAKIIFGFGGGSSGSGAKNRKRQKKRKMEAADEAEQSSKEADDPIVAVADLSDDESFRKYWQVEGRGAYEAFRQRRDNVD